jgi:hypothetical protein
MQESEINREELLNRLAKKNVCIRLRIYWMRFKNWLHSDADLCSWS